MNARPSSPVLVRGGNQQNKLITHGVEGEHMDVCYNRKELFEKLQPSPPPVRAGGSERPLWESCLQAALFSVIRPPRGRGVHRAGDWMAVSGRGALAASSTLASDWDLGLATTALACAALLEDGKGLEQRGGPSYQGVLT